MPNFDLINNGDSGLSVRTTLNEVINYVNTGITSGSSFTYITEDTTPGSEYVNILSPRDVYISGGTSVELEYYGSPTITGYVLLDNTQSKLHFDNGSFTSQLDLNSGGFVNLGILQGTDYSNIDLQTTDIILQVSDGTNTSTLGLYPTEQLTTIDDGSYTNTLSLVADNTTQTITDGTNTLTETKQPNQNRITIDDGGAVRNTSITQTFDSIFLQQGNMDYDGDITSFFTLNTKDSGVNTQLEMGTTNGSVTTQLSQGSTSQNLNWTDGSNNSQITLDVNGCEIVAVVGGDSVTQTIDPTLYGLDVTNGSSVNNLTLNPDYVMWDCNYVTGDTRVGLEFDPSGLYGVTRFWKENYVTNESSTIGLDTTDITLSSTDTNVQGLVGVTPQGVSLSGEDLNTSDGSGIGVSPQQLSFYTSLSGSSEGTEMIFDPLKLGSSDGTYLRTAVGSDSSSLRVNSNNLLIEVTDGVNSATISVVPETIQFKNIPSYDDNADAVAGGLPVDGIYITTGLGASPLDVAGILMIRL